MRIFKKRVEVNEQELFKPNGEFNLSMEGLPELLDTILVMLCVNNDMETFAINLELRRCGFFITIPEQKKIIAQMQINGHIGKGTLKDSHSILEN